MANEWKWKRGPHVTCRVTTADTVTKGEPVYISSNVATACADGGSVDLVAAEDISSGAVGLFIKPLGDIFEVKVATGTDLGEFARVYLAANYTVDAGAAGQTSQAHCVDYNPASGGCALISVMSALAHPLTYNGS